MREALQKERLFQRRGMEALPRRLREAKEKKEEEVLGSFMPKNKTNSTRTPQDKHKHSVFTFAQNKKYKQWKLKRAYQGKPIKSKQWWYENIYKKKSK